MYEKLDISKTPYLLHLQPRTLTRLNSISDENKFISECGRSIKSFAFSTCGKGHFLPRIRNKI
jgi:hypothetical protein